MNIENAAFVFFFFWVATETKWLIQRHFSYREMAPDLQREKKQEKQRREIAEH